MKKKLKNKLMLDALEIEQKRFWPTITTLEKKIDTDVVIPQTILDYGEY